MYNFRKYEYRRRKGPGRPSIHALLKDGSKSLCGAGKKVLGDALSKKELDDLSMPYCIRCQKEGDLT